MTEVEQDAHALLDATSKPCLRVIAVEPDCILYVDTFYKPKTAWLTVNPATLTVTVSVQDGFPAFRDAA